MAKLEYFISREYIWNETEKEVQPLGKLESTTLQLVPGITIEVEHSGDEREDFGLFSGKIQNVTIPLTRWDQTNAFSAYHQADVRLEPYDAVEAAKKFGVSVKDIKERLFHYTTIFVNGDMRREKRATKHIEDLHSATNLREGLDTVLGCVQ